MNFYIFFYINKIIFLYKYNNNNTSLLFYKKLFVKSVKFKFIIQKNARKKFKAELKKRSIF